MYSKNKMSKCDKSDKHRRFPGSNAVSHVYCKSIYSSNLLCSPVTTFHSTVYTKCNSILV